MLYQPLEWITYQDALNELEKGDEESLLRLPLRVGEYLDQWKNAQDICLRLAEHPSAVIRANAILGLAYTARTKGMLDKRIVKPYLLQELRTNTAYRWRIEDAITEINYYLKWNIAQKVQHPLTVGDTRQ